MSSAPLGAREADGTRPVACPVCAAPAGGPPLAGPDLPWRYRSCPSCGHHWLDPMPDEAFLAAYYNDRYRVPEGRYRTAVRREAPAVIRLLADRHPERGRLLEVGASYGAMLEALRSDGWEVEGVELDARAAARAGDAGLLVHTSTLEQAPCTPGAYDVVAAFHVLEHIREPRSFLKRARSLLREGGTLLLKTPNAAAAVATRTGGWWEWHAAPEHVHVYSPDSLRRILAETGFAADVVVSRRGDAHATLFELLMAGLKRRGWGSRAGAGAAAAGKAGPVSQRRWFLAVESLISAAGAPFEAVPARRWSTDLRGPELLVACRAIARR